MRALSQMEEKMVERWKTYTYGMSNPPGAMNAYDLLYGLSKGELARMVVDSYRSRAAEKNPDYNFMMIIFIEDLYFPRVEYPVLTSRSDAIRVVRDVEKAWMIEYIYHAQFTRMNGFPKETYKLDG